MQLSNEVRAVLSTLAINRNTVTMTKLERGLYLKVDQALQALGGKWNRKAKAHVFDGDPVPLIDQAITLGEVTTAKDLGFFPTPAPIARQLVELADVQQGHIVLEPSAGTGAIVDWIIGKGAGCVAIERDLLRRSELLRARASIHDWAAVHVETIDDFMEYATDEPFDRVVMNPPFCKVGLGDHLDHVRHAFSMLVPGGVLVSVLPNGVIFRQDRKHADFRHWIECTLDGTRAEEALQPLPDDAFKESGTSVRTCVVRLVKP